MKCPACGTRLSKGATFCHTCYAPIGVTGAPPPASTAASPPPVALSAPVTVIARRPPRADHRSRTVRLVVAGGLAVALILVALLLTRPWEGGAATARAGNVAALPILSGDGSGGQWRLGGTNGVPSVTSAQVPGCREGPCPGTMTVRFSDGSHTTVDDVSEIAEIGQIDPTHYLAVAGFCYLNCVVRVYGIDTTARSVTTVLDRAHPNATVIPMPQGACGFALTYRGATYTVRTVPDKASAYFASWLLYSGDKTCPSRRQYAGSSGAALGPAAGSPTPQSAATTQGAVVVAPPDDTPTTIPLDTSTPTTVSPDTPSVTPTTVPQATPSVPTKTTTAQTLAAGNILPSLTRDMSTRNYHATITQKISTRQTNGTFSPPYSIHTVATVIHRGSTAFLHMQVHILSSQSKDIGSTELVNTGKHVCTRDMPTAQFRCELSGGVNSTLLDLSPDATVTQFHQAATATIVGDGIIAGQHAYRVSLQARYVVQGKDGPVTNTVIGTLYTDLKTNLPISETIQSTVEGNQVTIARVAITWSHWDDPHLTIPSVPAS